MFGQMWPRATAESLKPLKTSCIEVTKMAYVGEGWKKTTPQAIAAKISSSIFPAPKGPVQDNSHDS